MINLDLFDQKRFSTRGGERTVQSDLDITEEPAPRPVMGDAQEGDTVLSEYPHSDSSSPNFSAKVILFCTLGIALLVGGAFLYKWLFP